MEAHASSCAPRHHGGHCSSPVFSAAGTRCRCSTVGRVFGPVFVRLTGGVGNQLFQVAAGAGIGGLRHVRVLPARRNGQLSLADLAPGLVAPAGSFEGRIVRGVLARGALPEGSTPAVRPLATALRRRTVRQGTDLSDAFLPRPSTPSRVRLLDGYFQHPTWFGPGLDEVTAGLAAAIPAKDRHGTVVHARGGDYADLGWALADNYYRHAIAALGAPGALHVVSDDAALANRIVLLAGEIGWGATASTGSAVDDFWAIASATNLVMSNSSFSWWAATVGDLLAQRRGARRTVTFPRGWVNGHGDVLCSAHWRAIDRA